MARDFDLIVYGATGFTGSQAARYLDSHPDRARFRYAIAGRSQERLEALGEQLSPDGILVADALDGAAIDRMVAETRVVITTAGPFARYGNELVRSCVEQGVHYTDITGETPWVRGVIDRFHAQASEDGTRIVPFCGYDSIPSDIGTLYAVEQLREAGAEDCNTVLAFHRGKGGINGGTVASLVNLQREGKGKMLADPFLLNPPGSRPEDEGPHRDPVAPFYSKEGHCWAAPFFMGAINTRVVRRSQALLEQVGEGYGPEFRYQEYWKADGPFGFAEAGTLASFQFMSNLASSSKALAGVIERLAPDPGSGPSESTMDNGFFSADLVALGSGDAEVRVRLEGEGDPGNRITIKCLCESALLLALEPEELPEWHRGGVLTPATALGMALVPRLERAGIQFSTEG